MPEAIKQQDLMVELDTSGDSIDIQLDEKTTQEKVIQEDIVVEQKDEKKR